MKCLNPIAICNPYFDKTKMRDSKETPAKLIVPCGKCYNCRRRRNRDWVARLLCEESTYNSSATWFITLTYDDNNLFFSISDDGTAYIPTLVKSHMQKWKKDFKSMVKYHSNQDNLRFFICGEYGKKSFRPHYHVLLFGYEDRGSLQDYLRKTWPYGSFYVDSSSDKVLSYCTKYIMKEQFGGDRLKIYEDNFADWQRPFSLITTKPALGRGWYDLNKSWLVNRLFSNQNPVLHFHGNTYPIPRLFIRWLIDEDASAKLYRHRWRKFLDSMDTYDSDVVHDVNTIRLNKQKVAEHFDSVNYDSQHNIDNLMKRYSFQFYIFSKHFNNYEKSL